MAGVVVSTKFVVCVVLMTSFYSVDGMRITQQTSTTYDDVEDDVSVKGMSQLLTFLKNVDDNVTPRDADDAIKGLEAEDIILDDTFNLQKGCSKGKCTLCKKASIVTLCVIAEVLPKGFKVSITVNGKTVAKKEITIPSPPPICVETIPGIKAVSHLCLTATKINLKEKSGCLNASFKFKAGPVHKTVKLDLGCFKIPAANDITDENDVTTDAEELDVEDVTQLIKMLSTGNDDVNGDMSLTSEVSDVNVEHLLSVLADVQELDLEELFKGCHKGRCHFCKKAIKLNVCVDAGLMAKGPGIDITVTVNGHRIYHKEISVRNPPPICFNHLRVLGKVTNFCLKFYDINLKDKRACLKVTFKFLVKKFAVKIGCFHIPVNELEALNEEGADTDVIASLEEVANIPDADDGVIINAAGAVPVGKVDNTLRFERGG